MSIADALRLADLEAEVAELLARVAVPEDMVADTRAFGEACQGAEASARATPPPLRWFRPLSGLPARL